MSAAVEQAFINLIYGCFVLFVLWFVVKKLDFSIERLVRVVAKEIRPIATLPWTRGSLNGASLILLAIFLILYFFLDRVRQLIELLHNLPNASHSTNFYEFAASWFFFGVLAFLSARSLPPSSL